MKNSIIRFIVGAISVSMLTCGCSSVGGNTDAALEFINDDMATGLSGLTDEAATAGTLVLAKDIYQPTLEEAGAEASVSEDDKK